MNTESQQRTWQQATTENPDLANMWALVQELERLENQALDAAEAVQKALHGAILPTTLLTADLARNAKDRAAEVMLTAVHKLQTMSAEQVAIIEQMMGI